MINLYIFGAKLIFLNEMKNNLLKSIYPHLIAVFAFMAILFIYYYPVLSGKKLIQNDVIQSQGALKEANDYSKSGKEEILWSNSSFSGMPVWRGYGSNLISYPHQVLARIIPIPVYMGMLAFIGFYILMLALNANVWVSFIGSAAFTFSSFNLISLEAGHVNKVLAMATMAPVIGGILMVYRKKYFAGAALTAFFLCLHIYYGHFQITYYLIMLCLCVGAYEFIKAIREKATKQFIIASSILIVSAIVAAGPNISQLWTTQVYSKSTTRGGSELTSKKADTGGLDYDYAMKWSNDIDEVLTILIPYYYGGGSDESLSPSSDTYKTLTENGVKKNDAKDFVKHLPMYWGKQPGTSPIYFGAIVFFLFVLGMFLVKDNLKWWILGISIFAFIMTMGFNMDATSKFLFYNFPLYNKFRSVTMAICIAQFTFPLLAGMVLIKIISDEITSKEFKKGLFWALGITGFFLMIGLFTSFNADFVADSDTDLAESLKQNLPEQMITDIIDSIRSDRGNILRVDVFRSFFFILVAAGLLWAFVNKKINAVLFYCALSAIIILDLTIVDKRYLNAENFQSAKNIERKIFALTPADELILKDTTYYRVYKNGNPFNESKTSYYHKSIGGYSAIKLGKYQDLIENQLAKEIREGDRARLSINEKVLNMLNAKYFLFTNPQNGEVQPQQNPGAMGNAWFVKNYKIVANADEEMKSLDSIRPAETVYVDKRFENQLKGYSISFDTSASIKLTSYHPNRLKYKSKAQSEQLAVFSEIYYQPGWNAYIDGKPADHFRANYVLRAMRVPAGEHVIDFKFEPAHYFITEKISLAGSILMILFVVGLAGRELFVFVKKSEL
jgi:hypothetical protein